MEDLRGYAADGVLSDGGSIHLRALGAGDGERLPELFSETRDPTPLYRLFRVERRPSVDELQRFLAELDYVRKFALAATVFDGERERIVGVGRYLATAREGAEVAIAVDREHQGLGIGTLLLEHLDRAARANGIKELSTTILASNSRLLQIFAKSGFAVRERYEGGMVQVALATEDTLRHREQSLRRERWAEAQSIARLLWPRAVAVIGASRDPARIGNVVVANLRAAGFSGDIYPINPAADEIHGLAAYPRAGAVGAPIDLAVICVPARQLEKVLLDCAAARVHAVAMVTADFPDSAEGERMKARVLALARASGIRLLGPNSMGLINTEHTVSLNATFAPSMPARGHISILTHSGAAGFALLQMAAARNLGVSTFVSVGERSDVSSNDLLSYWEEDSRTRAIVLCVGSFGNPHKFARLAPAIARHKPIIALKSGRVSATSRPYRGRLAAIAGTDTAVRALFAQSGIIRATTIEELFDVTALLSTQPVPAGERVAIVTNAGGPGAMAAGACEARGLSLAHFADSTLAALRPSTAVGARLSNPLDLTALADAEQYARAIAAAGNDPGVDALVAIHAPLRSDPAAIAAGIARGAAAVPADKPVLCVCFSQKQPPAELMRGPRGTLPCYQFAENAIIALDAAVRYGRWRSRPQGAAINLEEPAHDAIRAIVERELARQPQPHWLKRGEWAALLRTAGIDVADSDRASEGIPAVAGVTTDETFGPLIGCGLGGVATELMRDAAFRLHPVTDVDAAEMVESLRARPILDGYQGAPAADRSGFIDVILRLSALIEAAPEIGEIELTSLRLLGPGQGAIVTGARIELAASHLLSAAPEAER